MRKTNVTIRQAVSDIQNRLDTLLAVPETDRSEYVRGAVEQLSWCRDRIIQSIAEILPGATADDYDEIDESDDYLAKPPVTLSLIRPMQYATTPCLPERTHAYRNNQPQKGLKQCRWCGDIRRISHGEKIAAGHNNTKNS